MDVSQECIGKVQRWMTLTYFARSQQILVALGPSLYHGCISGVSWLSSRMDDLDLFFEVMGVDFNMKISNFHL